MLGFTWSGERRRVNGVIPALVGVFVFAGIATPAFALPPYQMTTLFSVQDFQPWAGSGPANLHGQAFLKTVGGDVKTCAGEPVILMPDNPYSEEMVSADAKGFPDANVDPRVTSYLRRTICDAHGNFAFFNLPVGGWYIDTKVTWEIPHIEQPGERPGPLTSLLLGIPPPPTNDQQGGELRKSIRLEPGENQAFLIGADEVGRGRADQASGASRGAPNPTPASAVGTVTSGRITSPSAPILGVKMVPTPAPIVPVLKMDRTRGLWILTVDENSAAARAGLSPGDVVLSGNGTPWDTLDEAVTTLNSLHPGEMLTLVIWKAGSEKSVVAKF